MAHVRKSIWAISLLLVSTASHAQTRVKYIHTDTLGSVVAVTDASRTVLERREYEPYGQQLAPGLQDGPGYTGHVQDAATGMVYMQQRYYNPEIGLFLSVDPVAVLGNPVGQFNRYRYANSNPYRFSDPDGRSPCPGASRTNCIQADTYVADRSTGQTAQVSDSVGRAMVDQKNVVAVPEGGKAEKIGFVMPAEGGGHKVELAADAVTASTSRTDSASATIPEGAAAVIHGHIDGRSDGVISPADAAPLKYGLPNGVVSEGRVGVTEIVSGRLQFRMLDGRMSPREARELQRSLDKQQRQPEFMRPEINP